MNLHTSENWEWKAKSWWETQKHPIINIAKIYIYPSSQ